MISSIALSPLLSKSWPSVRVTLSGIETPKILNLLHGAVVAYLSIASSGTSNVHSAMFTSSKVPVPQIGGVTPSHVTADKFVQPLYLQLVVYQLIYNKTVEK